MFTCRYIDVNRLTALVVGTFSGLTSLTTLFACMHFVDFVFADVLVQSAGCEPVDDSAAISASSLVNRPLTVS